jgi:multidrug efflux pump
MFFRYFIDRPLLTAALIVTLILGGAGLATLTLVPWRGMFASPVVEVSAHYPGANAQVVAETVGLPIEHQINGVEGLMSVSSQYSNDGDYTLTLTFQPGSDPNISQVLVQNRVSLAQPMLPELVNRLGVTVKLTSPSAVTGR